MSSFAVPFATLTDHRARRRSGVGLILAAACLQVTVAQAADPQQIARDHMIVDTHIDVPYRIEEQWEDVTGATEGGDYDTPRARAGGLNIPFMSIYIPAAKETEGGAWQLANQLIDGVEAMAARAPQTYTLVSSVAQAEDAMRSGLIGLAMGIENGAPLEGDLKNLRHFYDRGVRYITLAHSKSNHIADSSYDTERRWEGLSPFGEEVVREMNRLGIMIDVSHVSDAAFEDVLKITSAPVIASHSSARHFTPDFERNISDAMIKALADNGGVVHINFGSAFLTAEANAYSTAYWAARAAFAEEHGYAADAPEMEAFATQYREEHPYPYATMGNVLDHFDHVIKLVGVRHVGVGSDFDGVGDSLPENLKHVGHYPNLIAGLLERGYSEEDIGLILGGNLLRVWRDVEAVAARSD